jgi:hypothetical protein
MCLHTLECSAQIVDVEIEVHRRPVALARSPVGRGWEGRGPSRLLEQTQLDNRRDRRVASLTAVCCVAKVTSSTIDDVPLPARAAHVANSTASIWRSSGRA